MKTNKQAQAKVFFIIIFKVGMKGINYVFIS